MSTRIPVAGRATIGASLLIATTTLHATPVVFTLDENLSTISLNISSGSSTSGTAVLHLAGDVTLDLEPAVPGAGWEGSATLTDLNAGTFDGPASLSISGITLEISSIGLTGIDLTAPPSPAMLADMAGIAMGTQSAVNTIYEAMGYAYTFLGNGPIDFVETATTDWDIQVADPAALGLSGSGVGTMLQTQFTQLVPPTSSLFISADISLAGVGTYSPPTPVPLPGALLLILSGLAGLLPAGLRRRRDR